MERKRNTWSEEETMFFLGLLKEKKILQVLDGKRFKASEVYKALEKEILKKGYNKDANMMKPKFKNLIRIKIDKCRINILYKLKTI